jgi:hypothetical protein
MLVSLLKDDFFRTLNVSGDTARCQPSGGGFGSMGREAFKVFIGASGFLMNPATKIPVTIFTGFSSGITCTQVSLH